jgi:hypothetical protein
MTADVNTIIPRYEFRAFAQSFGRVVDAIRSRSACEFIRESTDTYLVTAVNDSNNVKLRYNQLDVKALMTVEQTLEQWRPVLKLDFPVPAARISDDIFPLLGIAAPVLPLENYSAEQFLDEVAQPHSEVRLACVFKQRFHFTIGECRVEINQLLINGAAIQSIAVESENLTAVLTVRDALGLGPYQNVNYLLAIKRILGLSPLSLDNQ